MFLHINLESGMHSRQLTILSGVEIPIPRLATAQTNTKNKKKPKTYISDPSGLNEHVHNSKVRRRLNKYGFLQIFQEEASFVKNKTKK